MILGILVNILIILLCIQQAREDTGNGPFFYGPGGTIL